MIRVWRRASTQGRRCRVARHTQRRSKATQCHAACHGVAVVDRGRMQAGDPEPAPLPFGASSIAGPGTACWRDPGGAATSMAGRAAEPPAAIETATASGTAATRVHPQRPPASAPRHRPNEGFWCYCAMGNATSTEARPVSFKRARGGVARAGVPPNWPLEAAIGRQPRRAAPLPASPSCGIPPFRPQDVGARAMEGTEDLSRGSGPVWRHHSAHAGLKKAAHDGVGTVFEAFE